MHYSSEHLPNVVKLNVPSDRVNHDGAAWIYIPHKDTIYIGPSGSSTLDLTTTVKSLVDLKSDEKPITGVLYDDGGADTYQVVHDEDLLDSLVGALDNYHELYPASHERSDYDAYHEMKNRGRSLYELENDEDLWDDDDATDYTGIGLPPQYDTGGRTPGHHMEDYNSMGDPLFDDWDEVRDKPKSSPGLKHMDEWNDEDFKEWREKREREDYGSGFGSARENVPHFRWSYGDSNLVPNPPHEGLWMWPVQNGYPDHFSQTGWEGLGNCSQGRVYPHIGDKFEILTWPERPQHVSDPLVIHAIQSEAQNAAKQWVLETYKVPEENIYFTEGDYGQMVSQWDSPSYPDQLKRSLERNQQQRAKDNPWVQKYHQDAIKPEDYASPVTKDELTKDDKRQIVYDVLKGNGGKSYDPQTGKQTVIPVTDLDQIPYEQMTPEERYEYSIRQFEREKRRENDPNYVVDWTGKGPNLNKITPAADYDTLYQIQDQDGKITHVSEEMYNLAVEEYGPTDWWRAFFPEKKSSVGEGAIKDLLYKHFQKKDPAPSKSVIPETPAQPNEMVVVPETGYMNGPKVGLHEAFVWIGNEDGTSGKIETGSAHWRIIDRIMGKTDSTLAEYLKIVPKINTPLVSGWVLDDQFMDGMEVTFLTHFMPMKQDLDYIPTVLQDLANHYHRPVEDFEVSQTKTPVLETFTPLKREAPDTFGPPFPGKGAPAVHTRSPYADDENPPAEWERQWEQYVQSESPLKEPASVNIEPLSPATHGVYSVRRSVVTNPANKEDIVINTAEIPVTHSGGPYWETWAHGSGYDEFQRSNTLAEAINTHADVTNKVRTEVGASSYTLYAKTAGIPLRVVPVDPPEGADHEEGEKPFVYYPGGNTLYESTRRCHHYNIMPFISKDIGQNADPFGTDLVSGDITDPEYTPNRNWIKFINGDTFDQNVIDYFKQKYPDKELIYNEYGEGWQPLPADRIRKPKESKIPEALKLADTPRSERLKEWRWSYDPDSEDLKVWEVENGTPSHFDMTGTQGQFYCAQGRIYLTINGDVDVFYWKARPTTIQEPEKSKIQAAGFNAAWNWVEENGVKNMAKKEAAKELHPVVQQMIDKVDTTDLPWLVAYSPEIKKVWHQNVFWGYSSYQDAVINQLHEWGIEKYALLKLGNLPGMPGFWYKVEDLNGFDENEVKEAIAGDPFHARPVEDYIEELKSGDFIPDNLLPTSGCFGFVNGQLILAQRHHQEIMYRLLENGWTWEDLMNAKQVWGWFYKSHGKIALKFNSDAGYTADPETRKEAMAAFTKLYNVEATQNGEGYDVNNVGLDYGGSFEKNYGENGYKKDYDDSIYHDLTPLPSPPAKESKWQVIGPPPKKTETALA